MKRNYKNGNTTKGKTTKSRVVTMNYNVTDIEFDFDDDIEFDVILRSYALTFDEEIDLRIQHAVVYGSL